MKPILIITDNYGNISKFRNAPKSLKDIEKQLQNTTDWKRAEYYPNYGSQDSFIFHSYGIGFTMYKVNHSPQN